MAVRWPLKDKPLVRHHANSQLQLELSSGGLSKYANDGIPPVRCRFCTAARTQHALPLLATLAAATAVVVLVYLCSLSIGRRNAKLSMGRKLAASGDGDQGEDSQPCKTNTDAAPGTLENPSLSPTSSSTVRPSDVPEAAVSHTLPLLRSIVATPSRGTSLAGMSQLHTGGSKKSKGTRKRQQKGAGRGAKAPRLEVPPQATEPTTHLPPDAEQDLASSIRSALSGGLHALSEQAWLQDEGTVSLQPLSQQESSDSSERSSPAEWMSSDTTRTHEEALDKPTLTGMRPVMPSSSRGHRQEAKREKRKMPGAAAGGRPDAGYGPSSEPSTSQGVSASETMQLLTGSPRLTTLKPSLDPMREAAATSAGTPLSDLRSLLSRPSEITGAPPTPPAVAEPQPPSVDLVLQADNSLRRLLDAYRWLRRMFREMPEHVLRTHPFYHHPERQLRLSNKVVSVENIKKSIVSRQKAISVLVDIRAVLRKQFLTAQEYETLVSYTERLCGYACGTMSTNINTKAGTQILGRMFIILDTLHCAAEALGMGANRAAWWPVIINRIESRAPSRDPEEASWLSPINHALTIAIEYYKRGLRPPMGLVIGLKLILFVSPKLTDFKELKWDPWRDDALHWFEAVAMRIQHSEQSRKDSEGRR